MTLTTLIAQLREKAEDKGPTGHPFGPYMAVDSRDLTAVLDVVEAARDALTCTATWSQPGKTCPDTAIHRGAWCKACLTLARFDAELGSKP